ncbi:M20/M25/M40 family metallo-hydrolase [Bizionia saleffrena]|uniref:M20/M25/M40 family metallo-hydrolase n=1 Tax=Bizionia saleffrena TaxID=291189 RepID=A0A8H2LGY8_9FLAO|nr:M28 family peptidase [Bizionia saleffrena]TYB74396.1 M20/M25/M40 family metallo-hydrolase [Bizionia saleffrena]
MRKLLVLFLIPFLFISVSACKSSGVTTEKKYTVTADEVKAMVSFLASDELKGRDTGSEGINTAATYIANEFKALGIKPYFEEYRDTFKMEGVDAFNVVGYIEGNDATLKDEFIIIGAHYDHIGEIAAVEGDVIANGANDNAAGTSAVMTLAKYFSTKKTKRSLLFVAFTAEEKGLLGSKHLANTLKENNFNLYAMFNLEMIGVPLINTEHQAFLTGYDRSNLAEVMNTYAGQELIGSSEVAKKYGLFKRSDNYPFFKVFNVPAHTVSSCDLTNFDFYHHVHDEIDKLDYTFMANLINALGPVIEKTANASTNEIQLYGN